MQAIIIAVGDEVLTGEVVNTNSAFLARELSEMGIELLYHLVVPDSAKRVSAVFRRAYESADIVMLCGGMGPTKDDLTKNAVAEAMGLQMVYSEILWKELEERFAKRNFVMTPNNRSQCYLPEGSMPLKNDYGTAPGIYIETQEKAVVLLPGPPKELQPMFERNVKPKLLGKINQTFVEKYYMTSGIGESPLEEELRKSVKETERFSVNTYLTESGVMMKAVGKGKTKQEAESQLTEQDTAIRSVVGQYLYSETKEEIWEKVGTLLIEKNITISAAESCTAGLFSSRLTQVAGISSVFPGSVVSYSNQVKNEVLGVKAETLARWGAVSEQTALEMAQGARAKFHTDCAVSITGIAGPGGGSEEKPVGLVYVCVNFKGKSRVTKNIYIGDRSMVRRRSVLTAFQILYGLLAFD